MFINASEEGLDNICWHIFIERWIKPYYFALPVLGLSVDGF